MTTEQSWANINAAASIIGDISTGIYRSPANALKELVSNAFDAGARQVFISTDYPALSNVSCYDNGPGISRANLENVFKFIGGSDKRLQGSTGAFGRPLIGKIGIGILAMSQISPRFAIISSQEGDPFRIEAEIDIEPFETTEAASTNLGQGTLGRYRISTIPESEAAHYLIVATPGASEVLRSNLGPNASPLDYFAKSKNSQPKTFRAFVEERMAEGNRGPMNSYDSFLWELAALCPIPYFDDGPVAKWEDWRHVQRRLESYRFSLEVDGYELRKPLLMPTMTGLSTRGADFQIYPFSSENAENTGLEFEGYIFHQRTQIMPPELRGLLVRIRNVGIGGTTLLY